MPAKVASRILIIDDEQGILDLLAFELGARGYFIDIAHNGIEGLEKVKNGAFNLVISDMKMPKLSGIEALEEIKHIDPTIEVIVTTGFGSIDMAVECMKKGAYDFVSKPYNLDELNSRIEKALEKQRMSTELISLKELNRLKSEFLARTSHELRTPMNAIIGYTSLILDKIYGELNPQQETALRRVSANAGNLLQIINNILDISKLSAGTISLNMEDVNLKDLFRELIDETGPLAHEKNLHLIVAPFPDMVMSTDRGRLKQVLNNLISNAIKFTQTGAVTIGATLFSPADSTAAPGGVALPKDSVRIEVADTGIGIRPEDQESIFEEFSLGSPVKNVNHSGTGLGLAIVKKMTELMNGSISLFSEPGKGSTFTLEFTHRVKTITPAASVPTDVPGEAQPGAAKMVLVIDDDPEVLSIVKDSLISTEFSFIGALNGDDGLALAKRHKPLAIALDIHMPYRDGWSVLQALKNDPETWAIPVIILSHIDNNTLGFSLGVTDYVIKPFDRKTLMDKLTRLDAMKDKKILVVDDDRELNLVIQMLLTNAGYQISSAYGGAEALLRIERDHPDIVLLDLMMPEVSGFDVIERMRTMEGAGNIRVIVMTAKTLTSDEIAFLNTRSEIIIEKSTRSIKEILSNLKNRIEAPYFETRPTP